MVHFIIRKVWYKKSSNQLTVTIPKDKDIFNGDYVRIEKVNEEENKIIEEEN